MKLQWGRGNAALGFGIDKIETMVSMTTDSSHSFIMKNSFGHSSTFFFYLDWKLFILAGNNNDMHKSLAECEIQPDPTADCGVSCP